MRTAELLEVRVNGTNAHSHPPLRQQEARAWEPEEQRK